MELWQILVQKWTLEQPLMHPKIIPKLWFCRGGPIWGPRIVLDRFLCHPGRHLAPFWLHFGRHLGPFWLRPWPFHGHLTEFFYGQIHMQFLYIFIIVLIIFMQLVDALSVLVKTVRQRSGSHFVFIFHTTIIVFWYRCIISDILGPFSGRFLRAFVGRF